MKSAWRLTAVRPAALRLTLVPALALMAFVAPGRSQSAPADLPAAASTVEQVDAALGGLAGPVGGGETADLAVRPQGRLRKLHLVRPDLIPYPIAHEVYC